MSEISPVIAAPVQTDAAPFDRIVPERIVLDVIDAIACHRAAIEHICVAGTAKFGDVMLAKEAADLALAHIWSPIAHLNRVADTPALREAHAAAEALLIEHQLWMGQNRAFYEVLRAVQWNDAENGGGEAEQRLHQLTLRDFELSGVRLEGKARARYRAIVAELAQLSTAFGNAVLDATDGFHLDIHDAAILEGVPEIDIDRFQAAARAAGIAGWRIGLQGPDVQAVLQYADSRKLRAQVYKAFATRASDVGRQAGQFDNSQRIEQIMALRHEASSLLGFASSAEHSLVTKMASTPNVVEVFLLDLARLARPAAERDLALVKEVAAADLGIDSLRPWDIAYVTETIRSRRFAFDAEAVRAYFPANQVIAGVMTLIDRLFGVRFVARPDVPVWHADAHYHDVINADGAVIAGVYLDLFARAGKRDGAWMDVCRRRYRGPEGVHLPVAFLTCNFASGSNGAIATLRHDDVVTFLHEFGHVLHHILTDVDYPSIGGISGVEWDAVELPSQLMENFAWEYPALAMLSSHVETGEPLPRELFNKMQTARTFQAGMRLCRQIELALFDLRLHRDYNPQVGARTLSILREVRDEVAVVKAPAWNRFPHSFTHIFAGGYSAGYYSYLWAELLSADAFGRFREAGGICAQTGAMLRREILARGATRTAAENFAAFRGRDPEPRALLESHGLDA